MKKLIVFIAACTLALPAFASEQPSKLLKLKEEKAVRKGTRKKIKKVLLYSGITALAITCTLLGVKKIKEKNKRESGEIGFGVKVKLK